MKDSFAEINIVPLVDIMLVLLVIVLMTANFMVNGMIEVKLPQSSEAIKTAVDEMICIEVAESGVILYEGATLDASMLAEALQGADRNSQVVVRADRNLTLQPFVSLLDILKKNGFTKISIQTAQ